MYKSNCKTVRERERRVCEILKCKMINEWRYFIRKLKKKSIPSRLISSILFFLKKLKFKCWQI